MLDKFWSACSIKASVIKVTDSHDSTAIGRNLLEV